MVKKKIVMLALTAVLLLTTYSVPVSAAENAAVIGTVASAQTRPMRPFRSRACHSG